MEFVVSSLDYQLFDNPLKCWLYAALTICLFYLLTRFLRSLILKRMRQASKAGGNLYDMLSEVIDRVHPLFLAISSLYIGTMILALPELATQIIHNTFIIVVLLQFGRLCSLLLRLSLERYRKSTLEKNAEAVTALSSVTFILRMVLWGVLLLVALDNFGVNVTTLIAGLGVGGIAVALSVQNILGDLFASFSILLDKPFVIGDFIIVGEYLGTVEYVGLKTTRLRSLSGEQLVFSNTDLLNSRIRNYKRMHERRVEFTIGVQYRTEQNKLRHIPMIIRDIIEQQQQVRFDRAHFKSYGAYSLDFEVVYWVHTPDYTYYMDVQQAINLEILRRFKEQGIEFAYPTHTLLWGRENTTRSVESEETAYSVAG